MKPGSEGLLQQPQRVWPTCISLFEVRGLSVELDLLRPLGAWLELPRFHLQPSLIPESLQGELSSFKALDISAEAPVLLEAPTNSTAGALWL